MNYIYAIQFPIFSALLKFTCIASYLTHDYLSLGIMFFFIILMMMPISGMLNISTNVPDWKIEDKKKKDEEDVIKRLMKQREEDKDKTDRMHRYVYDRSFSKDAILSIHLIGVFHNMTVTQTYYQWHHYMVGHMVPKPTTKGLKGKIVDARGYLNVSGYDWK